MKKLICFLIVSFLCVGASHAQIQLTPETTVSFATKEEGREILSTQDVYTQNLSPFDFASKMKTNDDVTEEQFLEFAAESVLEWSDVEREAITSLIEGVQEKIEALKLPLPEKVLLIKTDGSEEGGAPYTRSNAVILPEQFLMRQARATIQSVICHELFHVMSRANPELRDKLYASIGFVPCKMDEFPPELVNRKITNPDAPTLEHCIQLQFQDKEGWFVPVTFASVATYDVERGGEFFQYLRFGLLLVERDEETFEATVVRANGEMIFVSPMQVSGFYEQIGRNTDYILHPEEILADNFELLATGDTNFRTPEVIEEMERILTEEE
jgi:hypothetical protein